LDTEKVMIKQFKYVFEPKTIAVVGASNNPVKVGYTIVKNLVDEGFNGKIYPVNLRNNLIQGLKAYPKVSQIPDNIDCAVIAIPAKSVPKVLEECGIKKVKSVVIISGGFKEVGNIGLEQQVIHIAQKYGMLVIGPNIMGVLNPKLQVDSIFLPIYKLKRPHIGGISVITQSGAIGGSILEVASESEIGIAKFVSYGNAAVINETHLLQYLGDDDDTKIILMYIEGVQNGVEFLKVLKKITPKKPVIILKAGKYEKSSKAALSHTGSMAGDYVAYLAAFRQAGAVVANKLDDLFNLSKIFSQPFPKGKKVMIITNGGGNGVLTVDAVEHNKLDLYEIPNPACIKLKKILPSYALASNPLDLVGDADSMRYAQVLDILLARDDIDMYAIIVLFQTMSMNSDILNVLINFKAKTDKPVVLISTGGEYTRMHRRILDLYGIPTYDAPEDAVYALRALYDYGIKKARLAKLNK
jgi:acetyl coenzyme A synthetase (ADP forming)-like protein